MPPLIDSTDRSALDLITFSFTQTSRRARGLLSLISLRVQITLDARGILYAQRPRGLLQGRLDLLGALSFPVSEDFKLRVNNPSDGIRTRAVVPRVGLLGT